MEEWQPVEERTVPKAVWFIAPIAVLGAAGGYYFYTHQKAEAPAPVAQELPPPQPAEPAIKHPIPDAAAADEALPALNDSDASLRGSLAPLADAATLDRFLVNENLVRNIVVTIDNLPRSKVTAERRPVKPTPGAFVLADGEMVMGSANYARYAPFVKLFQTTDTKQLTSIYFRYYPLFQQAYESLGYPDKYFNDRLVEVIDHLLATPTPAGPVELAQPNVFYEYADPDLEARSAGQKLLLRMGTANAEQIKGKLREVREVIVTKPMGR